MGASKNSPISCNSPISGQKKGEGMFRKKEISN